MIQLLSVSVDKMLPHSIIEVVHGLPLWSWLDKPNEPIRKAECKSKMWFSLEHTEYFKCIIQTLNRTFKLLTCKLFLQEMWLFYVQVCLYRFQCMYIWFCHTLPLNINKNRPHLNVPPVDLAYQQLYSLGQWSKAFWIMHRFILLHLRPQDGIIYCIWADTWTVLLAPLSLIDRV